jgi:hypothetical protein
MIWILSKVCTSVCLVMMYGRCAMEMKRYNVAGMLSMAYTKI